MVPSADPSPEGISYLSAVEAVRLFRDKALSPVEVVEAQIARAEAVEPTINAFSETFFENAIVAARRAEQAYARGSPRPLEGVTVAVKETMDVKGQRTTFGSLVHQNDPPAEHSHPMVERLQRAGAIVHARTTAPEFSSAWITVSRLHGITATPWNPEYTCGGSSGGSGASLAAGTAMLATGEDYGGSIRAPAAACGVVGYKPPYGRIPSSPPHNLDTYQHSGPMTRTVSDCALATNIVCGPHPADIATLRQRPRLPLEYPGVEGWRIAWSLDVGNGVVSAEVERGTATAIAALEQQGAIVEEVSLGWGEEVTRAAMAYFYHVSASELAAVCDAHPDLVCDYTKWYARDSRESPAESLMWAQRVAADMYQTISPILRRFRAFVCPTFVTHEIRADQMPWERMSVAGKSIDTDYDISLMHQFNMLSRLPVLAVPSGIADNGLPTGIQIVAQSFADRRVFQVAATLERARPWLDAPERRPAL